MLKSFIGILGRISDILNNRKRATVFQVALFIIRLFFYFASSVSNSSKFLVLLFFDLSCIV